MRYFCAWILFLGLAINGFAASLIANDTVITTSDAEIISIKKFRGPESITDTLILDSIYINSIQPITKLLSHINGSYFNQSGPGSISTLSMNGGVSNATTIYWNDIKIISPTLGLTDYSSIPLMLTNEILILPGGCSADYGSGSMNGTVLLNSTPVFIEQSFATIMAGAGSYNDWQNSVSVTISDSNFYHRLLVYNRDAENNFSFRNLKGNIESQSNSEYSQKGILTENTISKSANEWTVRYWMQKYSRQFPPALTESSSQHYQDEKSHRIGLLWKRSFRGISTKANAAYSNEISDYYGPGLNSISYSILSAKLELDYTAFEISNRIKFGGEFIQANVEAYQEPKRENELYLSYTASRYFHSDKILVLLSARKSFHSSGEYPFSFNIILEKKYAKIFAAYLKYASDYRYAGLNDRYWIPGGNSSLGTEKSQSIVAGHHVKAKNEEWYFKLKIEGYYIAAKNKIVWLPESNIWRAVNINKIISNGINAIISIGRSGAVSAYELSSTYSHIYSINKTNSPVLPEAFNKQLIYVPEHLFSVTGNIKYHSLGFDFLHQFTGSRFVTPDNRELLPAYQITSLGLHYSKPYKQWKLTFRGEIENLFNSEYQVIQYRPMPLRNFNISIIINYQTNSNSL